MDRIIYEKETYDIRGAVFEVYREMGRGFLEAVYQECMEKELAARGMPFESHQEITLQYKGRVLRQKYIPDLICHGKIIVELKAVKKLADDHKAQVFNYLKGAGLRLGLLVNFGHYPKAEIQRIIL